jgi:hypothetical protein
MGLSYSYTLFLHSTTTLLYYGALRMSETQPRTCGTSHALLDLDPERFIRVRPVHWARALNSKHCAVADNLNRGSTT